MTVLHALILSVVEGITEFLPVSSTGHLILTADLLGIPHTAFTKSFEIIIQSGAILAVIVLYGKMMYADRQVRNIIMAAFLPTAVIGFLLYGVIKTYLLGNGLIVVCSLIAGGIILMLIDRVIGKEVGKKIQDLTIRDGVVIGLVQVISVIPGVSRSAATIAAGMFRGLNREEAVRLSFLLAVPTLAAATGYDLLKNYTLFSRADVVVLLTGFTGSFITALVAVSWLLSYVRKRSFFAFGIYRIAAGILFYLVLYR